MESQWDQAAEMIELAQHLSSSDGKNKSHLELVINDWNFQHVISSDIENDENQACQNFGVIEDTISELEQTIDGFIATISSQSLERFKEEEIQNESTQNKTPIKRRKTRLSSPSIGRLSDELNKFRDSLFRNFQNVSVSANGRVREDSTTINLKLNSWI